MNQQFTLKLNNNKKNFSLDKIILLLVLFCLYSCNKRVDSVIINDSDKKIDIKKMIQQNDKAFYNFVDSTKNINKFYEFENEQTYTVLGYACKLKKYDFINAILLKKPDLTLGKEDEYNTYDPLFIAI